MSNPEQSENLRKQMIAEASLFLTEWESSAELSLDAATRLVDHLLAVAMSASVNNFSLIG